MSDNPIHVLETVMGNLTSRQQEIEAILPVDLSYDRFMATTNQALRQNPKILKCKSSSIINACIKAAYDGLRIDGREAAIVDHQMTYNKGKPNEQKVLVAQYFPMAFGLVQQIYRGKEIIAMEVDVVREGDHFEYQKGTNSYLVHQQSLKGGGRILAAYSVATFKSGAKTFELLTRSDLDDIRSASQTDMVWNKWEGEMSKKSAVRRHRKMLPLGERDIVDSEADELFSEMGHNQPPEGMRLQQRPTRQSIADQRGTEAGQPIDNAFGDDNDGYDHVTVDQQDRDEKPREAGQPIGIESETSNEQEKVKRDELVDLPEDDAAWAKWSRDVEKRLHAAKTEETINTIAEVEAGRINAASKAYRDFINSLISERLTDLATGDEAQEASADSSDGPKE